ncbi:MAG: tetratricopeptide repeat protein, partial [Phycisphaerae bacterium]|nr:tetratricopeptide repeat protein [Phycisphaerae bacterium]
MCLLILCPGGFAAGQEKPQDPALKQFYLANAAYNRRLYPAAAAQFTDFLRKYGNHAKADHARYGLGLSQYALKQYDKAMPQFATLLAKKDLAKSFNREQLVMLQGQCLLHSGKKDDAQKLLIGAVDRFKPGPFKVAAIAAVADIAFGKAAWPDVLTWTGRVVASKPAPDADQLARALYQQGFAHHQLKKPAEAITSLVKVEPLKAEAIWKTRSSYLLGECYSETEQIDRAESAFAAALDGLTGTDADECRFRLGLARFQLKKYTESSAAFEDYLKHAKEGPRRGDSSLYIGRCFLEQGEFKQAERRLSQLGGGTDVVAAKANLWLGRVFSRQKGNYDRAAQVLAGAT